MQTEKYIGQAFSYTGIFDVVKVVETQDTIVYLVKVGQFTDKTWGNHHPNIRKIKGVKVLGINKTNFKFIRKLSSLEKELY